MTKLSQEIFPLIGQPENDRLEYLAVLPTARMIASLICAFANTNGGFIVLGVAEGAQKQLNIIGLSSDFRAITITHKACDLLTPQPTIAYEYVDFNGKQLFVIKIERSNEPVFTEDKRFIRSGEKLVQENISLRKFTSNESLRLEQVSSQLNLYKSTCTESKTRIIDHYLSVLNIIDNSASLLYPNSRNLFPNTQEGKLQMRLLFSSCADSFEIYLSDLLYEIYLANPLTLKSEKTVTLKEVLDCSDIQDFVAFYAKKMLSKLQRGSIKGFISENKQIGDLNAIDNTEQSEIEKILQVRHLYSHRNGIIDEKFLQYFQGQFSINTEHQFSLEELLEKMLYIAFIVNKVDLVAIQKHQLATV